MKKQKGFLSLELSMVLTVVAVVTVYSLFFIFDYFNNQKSFMASENMGVIKNFSQKTNFDFAQLDTDNYKYLPHHLLKANNGKLFLNPINKEIKTGYFYNSMLGTNPVKKIGQFFAIKNLKSEQCNIIGGVLAPKYFESYVLDDNAVVQYVDSITYRKNLIKLTPKANDKGEGRNKVAMSRLIEQCAGGNKTLLFKDASEMDVALYRLRERHSLTKEQGKIYFDFVENNHTPAEISIIKQGYFFKFYNQLLKNEEKIKADLDFYIDLIKYREEVQKQL